MKTLSNIKPLLLWAVSVILISGIVFSGFMMSRVEQAKYTIEQSDGNFEVRDYAPALVAEVDVRNERGQALSEGFRSIADYIFGNNLTNQKVAMTAPVTQQGHADLWRVRFVMPSNASLENLPKPINASVKIMKLAAKRFAVVRFSGTANSQALQDNLAKLLAWVRLHHFKALGKPVYAFYNPPWTLPLLRRNEVMLEIEP